MNLSGSDTITVTSTVSDRPLEDFLRITELNYNPHAAAGNALDNDEFEFVEFLNTSDDTSLNLTGVRFDDGVTFQFPVGTTLEPGEYTVVVRNAAAFGSRYDTSRITIAGEFVSGGLSNGGENLRLVDAVGTLLAEFVYDDGGDWPGRADGNASTLEVIDLSSDYLAPTNWQSSVDYGGSPGAAGRMSDNRVVINEILANSELPAEDYIELHNTTAEIVDLGGWLLSDDNDEYAKYRLPVGTLIDAGGYLVFTESDFGPLANENGFSLSSLGESLWLVATTGETPTHFVDNVSFAATFADVSLGRIPDGEKSARLVPLREQSVGDLNAAHRVGELVVSEIHYDPVGEDAGSEFIELYNATDATLDLGQWRIRGGVDMDLPRLSLFPRETVVLVDFDSGLAPLLGAFRTRYDIAEDVMVVGPWDSADVLANGGRDDFGATRQSRGRRRNIRPYRSGRISDGRIRGQRRPAAHCSALANPHLGAARPVGPSTFRAQASTDRPSPATATSTETGFMSVRTSTRW